MSVFYKWLENGKKNWTQYIGTVWILRELVKTTRSNKEDQKEVKIELVPTLKNGI